MAVVVDANLLVVMVSGNVRGPLASEQVETWITAGEEIHAPGLQPYELASALTRLVAARAMSPRQVLSAWEDLSELPVVQHPLADDLPRIVDVALRLKRQSATMPPTSRWRRTCPPTGGRSTGRSRARRRRLEFPVRLLQETTQ